MKLLTKVKTITARDGSLHFERWAIIETTGFALYLHRIHRADKDHLHSHPWNFWSVILKGTYIEELLAPVGNTLIGYTREKTRSPGVMGFTSTKIFHKIKEVVKGPVYTLVFTWGGSFDGDKWGYWVDGKKIPFNQYFAYKDQAKKEGLTIENLIHLGWKPK